MNNSNIIAVDFKKTPTAPSVTEDENIQSLDDTRLSIYEFSDQEEWLKLYSMTDAGNARRFIYYFGDLVRCVRFPDRKDSSYFWFVWDRMRWKIDQRHAKRLMLRAIHNAYAESVRIKDHEKQADFKKNINYHLHSNRIDGALNLSQSIKSSKHPIQLEHTDLDSDPSLFNVENGTIELKDDGSHVFREHRRDDHITQLAPITYDPNATCPMWKEHLAFIFRDDTELISFFQRAVGYSISGDIGERAAFFSVGDGADGKTTTLRTIYSILGDYAHQSNNRLISFSVNKDAQKECAGLFNKRYVLVSEIEQNQKLMEGTFKSLTGGDILQGRLLYSDPFEFRPTHRLWMYGNFKPQISGDDQALWDRIHLIPFNRRIPKDQQKNMQQLIDGFLGESAGILIWILAGYKGYRETGLNPPQKVKDSLNTYRAEMSTVMDFLTTCCHDAADNKILGADLHRMYTEWCLRKKLMSVYTKKFYDTLRRRGYTVKKQKMGNVIYGIAVNESPNDS